MATDAQNEKDLNETEAAEATEAETAEAEAEATVDAEGAAAEEAPAEAAPTPAPAKKKKGPSTKSKPKTKKKSSGAYYTKPKEEPAPAPAPKKGLGTGAWVGICAVALVLGLVIGYLIPSGSSSSDSEIIDLAGRTTIEESELDSAIATYEYNGTTYTITAREVLEQSAAIDDLVNDDGTYTLPNTEDILSYAQNHIVLLAADEAGIEVTDDDISELAEDTFGTDDIATIAEYYGIDEDVCEETLTNSAKMSLLRDSVCTVTLPDYPSAPDEADDEDELTVEYAEYIIALVGDEWDSDADTWASTDGDYYSVLSSYEISLAEGASYTAAYQAYYEAYILYYTAYTELYTEWNTYINSLLSEATITIGTLVVISS